MPMAPAKRAGEPRWPMALAVVAVGGLHAALPADFRPLPGWILQLLLLAFLTVLIVGDPGRIDRENRVLRLTTNAMIATITIANTISAVRLVRGILDNASFTDADDLLRIGGVVWAVNVLTFALWYWDLDCGGAAARAAGRNRVTRAFVFPETDLPEHADGNWYPRFVDYLALSFNTATAFGPTDVSAVKPWSKVLLMVESAVSLLVALLVFSRAINIWPSG
jgi:hypothetical protein